MVLQNTHAIELKESTDKRPAYLSSVLSLPKNHKTLILVAILMATHNPGLIEEMRIRRVHLADGRLTGDLESRPE